MNSSPWLHYGIYIVSLIAYVILNYFTARADFPQVIVLFTFLFTCYFVLLNARTVDLSAAIVASILFRAALLFSLPNLTDDFYRFIWDGRLLMNGENPFQHTPRFCIEHLSLNGLGQDLFQKLNSPDYFSVYPPFCQFIFFVSCKIAPDSIAGSVLIMKLIVLISEVGAIFLLKKLAGRWKIEGRAILWYALNPLVITELSGNLHWEAVMIFFLLLAIYWLLQGKNVYAALAFSFAVGVKLLPLIFLPLLLKRTGVKQFFIYCLICGLSLMIQFTPFFSHEMITNISSSIGLYFQKFEFNAGVYYCLRWVGYQAAGYNLIEQMGVVLPVLTIMIIALLAVKSNILPVSLPADMLFAITAYFVLATTVHPWYITSLVALSVFTVYRFAIVWSAFITLSYATYRVIPYEEQLWLVAIEYIIVYGWLLYELYHSNFNLRK